RHLPRDAYGEEPARRHRVGESHAADVRGSALGRLQTKRHRTRAGQMGCGGVPERQTGVYQSVGAANWMGLAGCWGLGLEAGATKHATSWVGPRAFKK